LRPAAVTAITAAAASPVSRLTCSPSSSADQIRVRAGWASCRRPTRATPPRASPAYQAKNPRSMDTTQTQASPATAPALTCRTGSATAAQAVSGRLTGRATISAQQMTRHPP
jgi:hypothetical protein